MALVAVATLAASLAACGGSSSAGTPAATGRPTTTTAAARAATPTTRPAPTTTTTMPPYSFDGSVPAPKIIDTGDDYEAIAQSLLAYIAWLKRHHPDPELVSEVYAEGTEVHAGVVKSMRWLSEHGYRYFDVDQKIDVQRVSVDSDLVTLIVSEHIAAEQVIDASGEVVEEHPSGPINESIMVLARDPSGRWRIADFTARTANAEVHL